jgi:hypothetical protein
MARSVGRKRSQRGSPRSKTLERYPEYMEFVERSRRKSGIVVPPVDEVASPEERLVLAHAGMQDHIAAEVLDHLRVVEPRRFEDIVLKVLTAMGCGGSDPERASHRRAGTRAVDRPSRCGGQRHGSTNDLARRQRLLRRGGLRCPLCRTSQGSSRGGRRAPCGGW